MEVLSPERLNAVVFGVFAGVALLIAVVGVAGVLAFSVSGRTREFGIRLAVGSQPRHLLMRVMAEGAAMALGGLGVGVACGFGLAQLAGAFMGDLKMPVTFIHGRHDPRTEPGEIMHAQKLVPGAEVRFIEGGRHSPHSETAGWRECNAVLRELLARE